MIKKLWNSRGGGSVYPILLVLITSFVSLLVIQFTELNNYVISMQKARYSKAVEIAASTAMATIELSNDVSQYNTDGADFGFALGDNMDNLAIISLGYTMDKQLLVDKRRFTKVFYDVLFRNFQVKMEDNAKVMAFKRYVPLKAIIQYDTMFLSTYEEENPDNVKLEDYYDDKWYTYRMFFRDSVTNKTIYLTLSDKCYVLIDETEDVDGDGDVDQDDMKERFKESNRHYFSVIDTSVDPTYSHIDEATKNRELANSVRNTLQSFVNQYKESHYNYNIHIGEFDEQRFINSVKDVTFFCLVEGIPIKSAFSKEPDRSFYAFKYGGASLKRADQ